MKPIELRHRILETVSKNGGHLASSLGAVEIAMALADVFDPEKDRVVWDVGHQAYAWKILTGRADSFATLRKMGGISGFPNPAESKADAAVAALGYQGQYFVDADHINLGNVDRFIEASDFFTIDVADYIGHTGSMEERFLPAIREAGRIYRHIAEKKGADNFVTEVSMDEVDEAQTPEELRYILREIAREGIPVQTIAPKFTGRFNKGVDYRGDIAQFEREFEQDLLVIDEAVKTCGLPDNLKLSIHSGSDKFSIYPVMGRLIRKYDKGIHIKTAGTTWLEENIGLAVADSDALRLAKKIYVNALGRMEELAVPYATVIDIDAAALPSPEEVESWDAETYARTLRHNPSDPLYNPSFRQLIHKLSESFQCYFNSFPSHMPRNIFWFLRLYHHLHEYVPPSFPA